MSVFAVWLFVRFFAPIYCPMSCSISLSDFFDRFWSVFCPIFCPNLLWDALFDFFVPFFVWFFARFFVQRLVRFLCPIFCPTFLSDYLVRFFARFYLSDFFRHFRHLYQNEVKCSAFDMHMIFHSHANKAHFHKKGWALGFILKVSVFGTRKWPIGSNSLTIYSSFQLIGQRIERFIACSRGLSPIPSLCCHKCILVFTVNV